MAGRIFKGIIFGSMAGLAVSVAIMIAAVILWPAPGTEAHEQWYRITTQIDYPAVMIAEYARKNGIVHRDNPGILFILVAYNMLLGILAGGLLGGSIVMGVHVWRRRK